MKPSKLILAAVETKGNQFTATHIQNEAPILQANYEERENGLGTFDKYDLDMGFKFASIPAATYLELQRRGISEDPQAIMRFLEQNPEYKTTKKRLI